MRLAICLFNHFPDSGLSRDMLRIVNEASLRGHAVTLFSSSWEGPVPAGAELVTVRTGGITNHGKARSFHAGLRQAIASRKFDSIIGFNKMPGLDIYFAADSCFVARAAGRHSRIYRLSPRYQRYRQLEEAVFSPHVRTQILSISSRENEVYRQFYLTPDQRFTLLPPSGGGQPGSLATEKSVREGMRRQLGLADDDLAILFVGSGFRTKGLDRAIRAVASLPIELRARSRLLVVGRDRQAPFERLANRCSVADRVDFLGVRDDVPVLLGAGDLLLHPAYAELAGAVILEALGAGLPVLASHVCGNSWHIDQASAGRVLPAAFSQTELNQTLADMLTSRKRPDWIQNGPRYTAETNFHTMAVSAVDTIEQYPSGNAGTINSSDAESLYVCEVLEKSLQGQTKFGQLWGIAGEVCREGPGRRTIRFSSDGEYYYLKAHSGVGWQEILKNLLYLRLPVVGARNEWDGVHRLRQIGIDTLSPAAYGARGRNPARMKSFIITHALPPTVTLEDYCAGWVKNGASAEQLRVKRWMISRLAITARTMHRSGANHRDFYLCHFLMSLPQEDGRAILDEGRIYLIDLHRMQLRRRTPTRWAVKDVAGLYFSSMDAGLTTRDCYRFMKIYSGCSVLREILRTETSFWRRVRNRAERMYRNERNGSTGLEGPATRKMI